ncbi:hypothetical protein TRFO_02143 [Tritrichomonas foetus]|uniref:Uncharacterized protein n=1 Tax=Tritrichomonas foetus TaxID=1144522 RepID=A0A1J4JC20_9EUKA|nr:hypothetical protein TRFO_02143 [Tritrichomonas foetus]|eukprot:OHS95203.1 hypothetical protein TRFO_02143 [Tritrichomonas foetus]
MFLLLSLALAGHNRDHNHKGDDGYIRKYSVPGRTMVILKSIPDNYSTVHYKPHFYEEVRPSNGLKPFGAFFAYGGCVKFDQPVLNTSIYSVKIPEECKTLYVSTYPHAKFRIASTQANVTLEKDQQVCYFHLGHPSRVDIKMQTEKYSKLKIMSIDNNETVKRTLTGSINETIYFVSSMLLYWRTTYFFPNHFVNITTIQKTNTIPLPKHSCSVKLNNQSNKYCTLLTDTFFDPDEGGSDSEKIEPTYHISPTHHDTTTETHSKETPNKDHDENDENGHKEDEFLNDGIVELIVLSVFAVSISIFFACCGLCCCCCCYHQNQNNQNNQNNQRNNQRRPNNTHTRNGLELEECLGDDEDIPPTIQPAIQPIVQPILQQPNIAYQHPIPQQIHPQQVYYHPQVYQQPVYVQQPVYQQQQQPVVVQQPVVYQTRVPTPTHPQIHPNPHID